MTSFISTSGSLYFRFFGDTAQTQYSINETDWNDVIWPFTIQNSAPEESTLKVVFTTNMSLLGDSAYFICGSSNIQFGDESLNTDSSRYKFFISSASNYPGLIQNGDFLNTGFSNVKVYNLEVNSNSSGLANASGWIGQSYFGKGASNCYILNCVSTGDISANSCGGIVGIQSASSGGNLTILGCSSSGNQLGVECGGIAGAACASNSGVVTINGCYSTGDINSDGGGIVGSNAASTSGNIYIDNCYSTGVISGGGGIVGRSCSVSTGSQCNINRCYSLGNIINAPAGGVVASNSGGDNKGSGTITVINCYSVGSIDTDCGGIFGSEPSEFRTISNCYTSGPSVTSGNGIFAGQGGDPPSCYSEANNEGSGWNDTNANTIFQSYGTSFISIDGANTPYKLIQTGYTLYSTLIINTLNSSFINGDVFNLNAGNDTPGILNPEQYNVIKGAFVSPEESTITVDTSSGIILTRNETPDGSYIVTIYTQFPDGSYIFGYAVLNVTGGKPPEPPQPPQPSLPSDASQSLVGSMNVSADTVTTLVNALAIASGAEATKNEPTKNKSGILSGGFSERMARLKAKSALIPNTKKQG